VALVDHPLNVHTHDLARDGKNNLFAYPAQSNFSSVQHLLGWIDLGAGHLVGRRRRQSPGG
jgi:hypothetical protein